MNRRLTRAEFDVGLPCPGCGIPWQGNLIQLCLNDLRMLADLSEGHAPEPGLEEGRRILDRELDELVPSDQLSTLDRQQWDGTRHPFHLLDSEL
ncbi:MAG: hypothetical protein JST64_04890 [Actinobacteria bacterium]|nr:hypothetical protein [Actinomycetota bacterium]